METQVAASTGAEMLMEASRALREALRSFDPQLFSGAQCAQIADELATSEKACSTARLLAAARAVALGAHRELGVADPFAWVARQGGTTGHQAREALELVRSLEAHPRTKEALVSGAVSVAQAREIARARSAGSAGSAGSGGSEGSAGSGGSDPPDQEQELLEVARRGDLGTLREAVRERTFATTSPEELHRRQAGARRFRHWRDALGMVCFDGALPPETGLPFVTRIEREAARRHRLARRAGSSERFESHAADALVALGADAAAGTSTGRTDLVVVCDLYAWRRGHAHEGEPCHLIGGGPIPVDVAKELTADAFLKVVLHDGVDIHKVHHAGRKYTAALRTALDIGPVPAFGGRACVDCQRTWGLEYDHDDPIAHTGPTSYANVKARCRPCHAAKTEHDRAAGLLSKLAAAPGHSPPPLEAPGDRRPSPQRRAPPGGLS